ncbi:Heavy metal-associated domain [Macleaya cordata]|uniref:Heavy metal-associated domain n=1 Tax=Macleaya cordata TaxID=56857 RepID=A0A200RB36_MACCD|nr:Heavy metal-associated domain [Macleaya cordata]
MATNQITVKGIVDPQALCARIQKKTKRRAKILSPLPAAEGEPIPQVVTSQVSGPITVELNVNMHCEACALQLKKKILKMRGVQTAETELSTGKVTVTGTMDADRLVDYVYRRTKKQARIVPQPEPEPVKEEEKKEEGEKPAEEAPKPEEKKEEENGEKKEEEKKEEEKKEDTNNGENSSNEEKGGENNKEEEQVKELEYHEVLQNEEIMKKMMYYYPPLYVIERVPPPQLFSDENPNACCIS